jgi:hypothetical protein
MIRSMLAILALLLGGAIGLDGQTPVRVVDGKGADAVISPGQWTSRGFYSGSLLVYQCVAYPVSGTTTWTFADGGVTSIVDSSNTATITFSAAHGLSVGNRITISGSTSTQLNTTYKVAGVTNTTVITVTTASVTDATYTTGVNITTTAPLTSKAVWNIAYLTYDASNQWTSTTWAEGSRSFNQVCDDRATLAYQ